MMIFTDDLPLFSANTQALDIYDITMKAFLFGSPTYYWPFNRKFPNSTF